MKNYLEIPQPDDIQQPLTNALNKLFKKPSKVNNVATRKVLVEKCYKGREMSNIFLRRTEAFYPNIHDTLDKTETQIEDDLIDFLAKIGISASKKSDKRSLPYNNVIISKRTLASDVSDMFDWREVYKTIISELLAKKIYKIRFYVHIETYEDDSSVMAKILGMCGLKYCFRYYVH